MRKYLAQNNPYIKMVVNILRAGKVIDQHVSEALKESGITLIQFNVLRILEAEHPQKLSLGEVADGLKSPTSDVSRLLDRLDARGLISRTICPVNRRKLEVSITGEGLEVIRALMPVIEEKLHGFYKDMINEEERSQLMEIVNRIQ